MYSNDTNMHRHNDRYCTTNSFKMSKSTRKKITLLLAVLMLLATATAFILTLELEHTYNTAINVEVKNGTIVVRYLTWGGKYMPMPPFSIICIGRCRVVSEEPRNITILFKHGGETIFRTIAGRGFKTLSLTIYATCRNIGITFKLCNYSRCISTPMLRLGERGRMRIEVLELGGRLRMCVGSRCLEVRVYYFTHLCIALLARRCVVHIFDASELYTFST